MVLTWLDWIVVGIYLAALAAVGIVAGFRIGGTEHYFLGKRHFGKLMMMAQSFGVGTHADMPVSLTGAVYISGISAVWYQWKNLFAMPLYWIMAPVFRRMRRTTTAEMMADRYGKGIASLYIVYSLAFFVINIASIIKGAAKVLNMILGNSIGVNHIVLILASIFVLYSFIGGLTASTWSDLIQGILIIVLSFMLLPLGWSVVGGLSGLRRTLPPTDLFLATPSGIGLWFIVMLTVNGIIGIMAQPHIMAAVGTGKTEFACRTGFLYGTLIKRICTVGWAFVGLLVIVMIKRSVFGVNTLADPEDAFGFACRHLLGSGFRGLLVASVMGAGLASCAALMIDGGALLTQDIYRPFKKQTFPESHYVWVGRWSGLLVVSVAVIYALFFVQKVLYSFLLTETLSTYIGIGLVGGLMWRRANRWGAAGSIIASLVANFVIYHVRHERFDYWDPNVFLASLLVGVVSLVVFSLLTSAESKDQVDLFFCRLMTPSDLMPQEQRERSSMAKQFLAQPGKSAALASGICRWDAENGRQLLVPNLLNLRHGACGINMTRAYRDDLRGLTIGFLLCAGLVAGLWALLHW